jgi:hypothetical protein
MPTQELKPLEGKKENPVHILIIPELSARIAAVTPAIHRATNMKAVSFTDAVHHLAGLGLQHYEPQS